MGKSHILVSFILLFLQALKILSVRAAIRLDEKPDNIEKVIFSSLMDGTGTVPSSQDNRTRALTDPLAANTWEEVLFNAFWFIRVLFLLLNWYLIKN